ncbi:MAG: hypothetical protein AAF404_16940 [Pseudomonadota bacterium]
MHSISHLTRLVVVFLSLYLTGCATHKPNIRSSTEVSQATGVILASVTASNGGAISYFYRKKGSYEVITLAPNAAPKDDYLKDIKKHGQLVARDAEPGEYELTGWSMFVYGYPSSVTFTPKNPSPISFTIEPGVVTYLGNLHTDVVQGKNIFRIAIPVDAKPKFGDDSDADLAHFPTKFPLLAAWPVRKAILANHIEYAGSGY